jgi:hypothetical protein
MRRQLPILTALAFVLFLSGCSTTHYFKVDALSAQDPQSAAGESITYVFAGAEEGGVDQDGLRARELRRQVERALAAKGYRLVGEKGDADLVISALAFISGPMTETESFSEPIYWRSSGYHRVVSTPVRAADGRVTYTHTTVYIPPRTEFAGYANRDRRVTVFEKTLTLSARANDGTTRGGEEVWTLTVKSRDRISDIRSHLPFMLAAALPYMGQQTEGEIMVRIRENDPSVNSFR